MKCVWTGNEIDKDGALILSEALKTNTTLAELNLNSYYETLIRCLWTSDYDNEKR